MQTKHREAFMVYPNYALAYR